MTVNSVNLNFYGERGSKIESTMTKGIQNDVPTCMQGEGKHKSKVVAPIRHFPRVSGGKNAK